MIQSIEGFRFFFKANGKRQIVPGDQDPLTPLVIYCSLYLYKNKYPQYRFIDKN